MQLVSLATNFPDIPSGGLQGFQDLGRTYSGVSVQVAWQGNAPPRAVTLATDGNAIACATCPEGLRELFYAAGDPATYFATTAGLKPMDAVSTAGAALHEQIAGGLRYVPAGEPLGVLAVRTPSGVLTRGALLNPDLTMAGPLVTSQGADDVAAEPVVVIGGGGDPPHHGNEGFALSSLLRRLYMVGGTADGTDHGAPSSSVWVLDLDSSQWTEYPAAGSNRPGTGVATTCVLDDPAAYFIDRKPGHLGLWAFSITGGLVEVAELPPAVRRLRLPCGSPRGKKGICSSLPRGPMAEPSRRRRSSFASARAAGNLWQVAGCAESTRPTLSQPRLETSGVVRTVPHPTGAALDLVPLSSFHACSHSETLRMANP